MRWSSFGHFFHMIAGGNPGKTPAKQESPKSKKGNDARKIRHDNLSQPPKGGATFPRVRGK